MEHEEIEEICDGDSDSVLGRVRDIRRRWAVQEDEALAYKLQDEEIAQHYNSNRTRNAIVREDAPRAREAQRQEELNALEERLRHLNLLQQQAEEDARLAHLIAAKESDTSKPKKHHSRSPNGCGGRLEKQPSSNSHDLSPRELFPHQVPDDVVRTTSPLLGAVATSPPPPMPMRSTAEPGPSRSCLKQPKHQPRFEEHDLDDDFTEEEDLRKVQEDRDAALAKALQEELDRTERDKQLAIEAQDRELAKMLHDKERARIRRAKEKARMKAEAMAAAAMQSEGAEIGEGSEVIRAASRSSSSSERSRSVLSGELAMALPPKIPEKQRSPIGDHIGFRAHPKPLPPHPSSIQVPDYNSHTPSPQLRIEQHHRLPLEPVPPYMPIHGYNRNSPKRNK